MRVGVGRVEPQRLPVAGLRFGEPSEVVVDVPEVEVRLEEVGLESDCPLVERLCLDQLVAAVVDVGQIDQRRNQIGIELERPAIVRRRVVARPSSSADAARKYSSASAVS